MERSESIAELATALSKAQAQFGAVKKTGKNPMFSSKYSTLDDVLAVVRQPMADNGLAFTQMLDTANDAPALTTYLMHSSGQWVSATVKIIVMSGNRGTNEVQVFGSALTYLKRYALAAMLGVAGDEDDDGNSAGKPAKKESLNTALKDAPERNLDETQPSVTKEGGITPEGELFILTDRVGYYETKNGKPYIGFWEKDGKYPAISWWHGRELFLQTFPKSGLTLDELAEKGRVHNLNFRVYYELDSSGKYKNLIRAEQLD